MRYIAKKEKGKTIVSGLKGMVTEYGDTVEVIIDTKEYDLKKLEEVIENYKEQFKLQTEQYENDIADLTKIAEAIKNAR
jgi:acylphosphatase